jgi:hypothetical protein
VTVTVNATGPASFVVNNTLDSGPGSLRQAILGAVANPAPSSILFHVLGEGIHTFNPLAPLPAIAGTLRIDGTVQPGYAGSPLIELNGAAASESASGLVMSEADQRQHSTINSWRLASRGGDGGHLIAGTYIGVDPRDRGRETVTRDPRPSHLNHIGTPALIDRNASTAMTASDSWRPRRTRRSTTTSARRREDLTGWAGGAGMTIAIAGQRDHGQRDFRQHRLRHCHHRRRGRV